MTTVQQLVKQINDLHEEIKKQESLKQDLDKECQELTRPLYTEAKEIEEQFNQKKQPHNKVQCQCRADVATYTQKILALSQDFKINDELRTHQGDRLVIENIYLRWSKSEEEFVIYYDILYSKKSNTYTYSEKALQENLKKGEWKRADKNAFVISGNTVFVHVVKLPQGSSIAMDTGDRNVYLGVTAKGNGVIFSSYQEIDPKKLPSTDKPEVNKVKLSGTHSKSLIRIPNEGQTLNRWERRVIRYIDVIRAVDRKEQEELLSYLL